MTIAGKRTSRGRIVPPSVMGVADPPDPWREMVERNPAIVLFIDPASGRILEASQAAASFYGYSNVGLRNMHIDDINMLPHDEIAQKMSIASALPEGSRYFQFPHRLASGEIRTVDVYAGPMILRGRVVLQSVIHDVTDHILAARERNRLAAAVDQASESVVIVDVDARIIYVNPAFERLTGYSREEVIGKNPRILNSGVQPPTFYAAMWASLIAGRTWHGELVNRRKDGSLFTEEASIRGVYDRDGTLLHYVGVKRDVTASRALQARIDATREDRATIAAMIADLRAGETPEATAIDICDRMLTLPGLVFASVALFLPGDRVQPLAALAMDRAQVPFPEPHGGWSTAMHRYVRGLRRQVELGPVVEPWPTGASAMSFTLDRLGVRALVHVPIRIDGEIIGFVEVGASANGADARLQELLPSLTEFGLVASLLLAPQLGARIRRQDEQKVIRGIIARRAFRAVYQPIITMADGAVVGYEALTRFADRTPPDIRFNAAAAAGIGLDLEAATLEAAIDGAHVLPAGRWLDLNVSPALVFDTPRLAALLWHAGSRPLVLEITEHEVVADYDALRDALEALGVPVRVAIDDAGAGYASLRHVLELRPHIIKLDRSLVAGIDSDPVRQGLVAGLRHFAESSTAQVIAEGVETRLERDTLVRLGIELGQGYLFGKARSASAAASHRGT